MSCLTSCFSEANQNPAWKGFWAAQPELNEPSLGCPQPCKWAERCVYKGPGGCGYVHPGEEGTGRKLFEARMVKKGDSERWEKATVRLIGRPGFYERRRLRLSWPEWCERQKMPAPVPLSAAKAPLLTQAKPQAPLLTQPQAPLLPPPQMMIHPAHMQQMVGMYMAMMAPYYSQQAPLPTTVAPAVTTTVAPPSYVTRAASAAAAAAASAAAAAADRDAIGNKLYSLISEQLDASVKERADSGLVHPKITAGKITAMILEQSLEEANKLCSNTDELGDMVINACETIIQAYPVTA